MIVLAEYASTRVTVTTEVESIHISSASGFGSLQNHSCETMPTKCRAEKRSISAGVRGGEKRRRWQPQEDGVLVDCNLSRRHLMS